MCRHESNLLNVKSGDSLIWKFICKHKDFIDNNACWRIKNGLSVKFFSDAWLFRDSKIQDFYLRPLSEDEISSNVAEWV